MDHPHLNLLERENFIWSLSSVALLDKYIHAMDGDPLQDLIKSVMHQYQTYVVPKRSDFRKCEYEIYFSFQWLLCLQRFLNI